MRFTSDYKRVTALFNTPVQETGGRQEEYGVGKPGFVRSEFKVGPFSYHITFRPGEVDPGEVDVNFAMYGIKGKGEKIVEIMSQLAKRRLSLEEANDMRQKMIQKGSFESLGLGGQYSLSVFGTVLAMLKNYVNKYHPKCIIFGCETKRENLYERMIKRLFPQAKIEKQHGRYSVGFRVCFV